MTRTFRKTGPETSLAMFEAEAAGLSNAELLDRGREIWAARLADLETLHERFQSATLRPVSDDHETGIRHRGEKQRERMEERVDTLFRHEPTSEGDSGNLGLFGAGGPRGPDAVRDHGIDAESLLGQSLSHGPARGHDPVDGADPPLQEGELSHARHPSLESKAALPPA